MPTIGWALRGVVFTLVGGFAQVTVAQAVAEPSREVDVVSQAAPPQAKREGRARFFDTQDGQLDLSYFLENPRGFLPVPIVVTEPAVGYGGGAAGMFIRPRKEAGDEGWARPDISVVAGLATQNGTSAAFAGDSRDDDHLRRRSARRWQVQARSQRAGLRCEDYRHHADGRLGHTLRLPLTPALLAILSGLQLKAIAWMGLCIKPDLSAALQAQIRKATLKALAQPAARERLQEVGFELGQQRTPDELSASLKTDYERVGTVLKAIGFKPE